MRIRFAVEDDFAKIARLWVRANDVRCDGHSLVSYDVTIDLIRVRLTYPDSWFAVGETEQGLAATAHGIHARDNGGETIPGLMHLSTVAVEPSFWGRGFGHMMTEFAIAQARLRGYTAIQLWTHETNDRAQRLYGILGFQKSGQQKIDDRGERNDHYLLDLKIAQNNTPVSS